jgi:hypothetical protein
VNIWSKIFCSIKRVSYKANCREIKAIVEIENCQVTPEDMVEQVTRLEGKQSKDVKIKRKAKIQDFQANVIESAKDVPNNEHGVKIMETAPEDLDIFGGEMKDSPPEKDPYCLCC